MNHFDHVLFGIAISGSAAFLVVGLGLLRAVALILLDEVHDSMEDAP